MMGVTGCPKTLVNKYKSMLHNIPEEQRSYSHRGNRPQITHGLESSWQVKCTVVGFCEHCNEPLGFTKGSDLLTK
jgi:hypothetical protein